MALFKLKPSSPGTHDPSQNLLTLTLGETAEIILWAFPTEVHVIGVSSASKLQVVEVLPKPNPNERVFRVTPREPGDYWVFAKAGSITGPDNSAPLHIVCLPRNVSSIGPEHVIIAASDCVDDAMRRFRNVSPSATVIICTDFSSLQRELIKYRDGGRRIVKLEFDTHGAPGSIGAHDGPDLLNVSLIDTLRAFGLATIFSPGARVFFHGCNVAEGETGLTFLQKFGLSLLCFGGGSVGGSTSLGISPPLNSSGKTYHLWGDTIRVFIKAGGGIEKIEGITPDPPPLPTEMATPP